MPDINMILDTRRTILYDVEMPGDLNQFPNLHPNDYEVIVSLQDVRDEFSNQFEINHDTLETALRDKNSSKVVNVMMKIIRDTISELRRNESI